MNSKKLFIGISIVFQGISGLATCIAYTASAAVLIGLSPGNINTMMVSTFDCLF